MNHLASAYTCISLLCLGLLTPRIGTAKPTEPQIDSLDLPEAVVLGSRDAVPLQSIGHSFDVLTRTQLAELPISSVTEALQYLPGLDLRQRGPKGVQADLSIRGGTFDQVLVLVNGIKLSDPQTGHHVLNVPVPLENVERIEVLKGPGARLYGQNAFAGAVNIVTRPGAETATNLRGELGQNGLAGFGVSLDLPRSNWRQTLSYQRDLAQGYRENTDYDIQHAFYQGEFKLPQNTVGVLAGLSDRAFGANGFYSSASATQQYEEVQTSLLALTHRTDQLRRSFSQRLSWRRNQDEYVFLRQNPSVYRNLHISQVVGYDAYQHVDNPFGRLGFGGELQGVWLASNNLGDRRRVAASLTAEQRFDLLDDELSVTPGLTYNYLSDAGSRLLPGVDIAYQLTERTQLYGNAGMTYRVPTYTDLYYTDRYNEGNPDLNAERAYAFEVGAKHTVGPLEARGALWQRQAIDLIDFVRDSPADTVYQPRNLADASFRGGEAELTLRRARPWLPHASVSYSYIDAELGLESGVVSRYVLDNLRHQFTARATLRVVGSLNATLAYRYFDRAEPEGVELADAVQLVDLRLNYGSGGYRLYAEATNLFDVGYEQVPGVPLPGRWVRAGVRLRL